MGWFFSVVRTVVKLGVILVGAVFLRNVSAFLLSFMPVSASISEVALTIATVAYLAAFAILVFGHSVRGMKWPVLLGFGVIALVLAAGGLVILVVLVQTTPALAFLLAGDLLFGLILLLFSDPSWLRALDLVDRSGYVAAIEVHTVESEMRASSRIQLRRVLSALALAEIPVGFRFQYLPDRHARLFLFTWAPDEILMTHRRTQLHQLLAAHVLGVTLSPCELPKLPVPADVPSALTYFKGTPGSAADGFAALLSALTKASIRDAAVLFQVFATPARPDRLDEWLTRRRVENQAQSARRLLAAAALLAEGIPPSPQQAEALSKSAAVAQAQQALQRLRKLDASDLLETQVTLTVWHSTSYTRAHVIGERLAARLTSALQAATPGASVVHNSPGRPLRQRQIHRLLRAVPTGVSSFLLPAEAAAYLGFA